MRTLSRISRVAGALIVALSVGCGKDSSKPLTPQESTSPSAVKDKMRESFEKRNQNMPPEDRAKLEKQFKPTVPGTGANSPGGTAPKKE